MSNIKRVSSNQFDGITIIIPTFRRPAGLSRAMESLRGQTAKDMPIEMIIADNDPDGGAETAVNLFAKTCDFPVHYIHVAEPGVANVRNSALAAAKGRYIAFLDDDQVAGEGWLEGYIDALTIFGAGLAFGPVQARSGLSLPHKQERLAFFDRDIGVDEVGPLPGFFGCGNSMMDRELCVLPDPVFSPERNETGGEDDLLFSYIKSQGVKIVGSPFVLVHEDVEDWRMSLAYIRMRSFAFGQGPSRICADPDAFNVLGLLKWMFIGLAQFLFFGTLTLFSFVSGSPKSVRYMRKAAEGAGKVLWFERFRPKPYGSTALKKQIKRETVANGKKAH